MAELPDIEHDGVDVVRAEREGVVLPAGLLAAALEQAAVDQHRLAVGQPEVRRDAAPRSLEAMGPAGEDRRIVGRIGDAKTEVEHHNGVTGLVVENATTGKREQLAVYGVLVHVGYAPTTGYLEGVRAACSKAGTVLILPPSPAVNHDCGTARRWKSCRMATC